MSQFDKLLGELDTLATQQEDMTKALPAEDGKDDDKIQAAAADGGGEEGAEDRDEEDEDEGEPMGKSLGEVTLPDGTKAEAVDGTELVKSLIAQIGEIKTGAAATEGKMAKALEGAVGLIKSQGEMIKSLSESVKKLSNEGRGRKAVLTIAEKPDTTETLKKSDEQGMTSQEFMAKSNAAYSGGRISGKELTVIDVSLRTGAPIEPSLIHKVLAESAK